MELRKINNKVTKTQKDNEKKPNKNKMEFAELVEPVSHSTSEVFSAKTQKKNIHGGHRDRLKNQFLEYGIDSLTDIQKLELLLFYSIPQKDTNPIAHALLDEFGTIKDVLCAEPKELIKIKGVKENTATLFKLVSSMLNVSNRPNLDYSISATAIAKEFCSKFYVGVDVEQFYVICLTKSNRVKKVKLIQAGTLDEINIQIRSITAFALDNKCNRIIVSHNHPRGLGLMSDEDCTFTYSLICSCLLNSIELLDHIIVGTDRAISLAEQKIVEKLCKKAVNSIVLPKDKVQFLSSLGQNYIICKE